MIKTLLSAAIALIATSVYAQQCPAPTILPSQYTINIARIYRIFTENDHIPHPKWYLLTQDIGTEDERFGLISHDGKRLIEPQYDELGYEYSGMILVAKDGKRGFLNSDGEEVFAPQFTSAQSFRDGLAAVSDTQEEADKLIDTTGKVVFEGDYDFIESFSEGIVAFAKNGQFGYMTLDGKVIADAQFDVAWPYYHGVAFVVKDKKWGVLDKTGQLIIPVEYEFIYDKKDGNFVFELDGKYGVFNAKGEEILPAEYDELDYMEADEFLESNPVVNQSMMAVAKDNLWGIVNEKGEEVLPLAYDKLEIASNGLIIMTKGDNMGVINTKGEEIIPAQYAELYWNQSTNTFISARKATVANEKSAKNTAPKLVYSALDSQGKEIFTLKDGVLLPMDEEGIYGVLDKTNKRSYLVDSAGKALSDNQWDWFEEGFEQGLAVVSQNGLMGLVNTKGEIVIPPIYHYVENLGNGRVIAELEERGLTRVLDDKGCVLIEQEGDWKQ